MDIDNFKKVNDQFGHFIGDNVIKRVAKSIKDNIAETDVAVRYGGEEFVIILPTSSKNTAIECIERVRHAFNFYAFDSIQEGLRITVSTGLAHFNYLETGEELIARADKALYQAKMKVEIKYVF